MMKIIHFLKDISMIKPMRFDIFTSFSML